VATNGQADDISCLAHKFSEIINPKPEETRTKEQIIDEMDAEFEKLGFKKPLKERIEIRKKNENYKLKKRKYIYPKEDNEEEVKEKQFVKKRKKVG
jgi:hypothetical protein